MPEILVALDVSTAAEARALADRLRGTVGGFKIGKQLFTSEGPSIVRDLISRGDRVFLDLKFHDIPNTVASAVGAAASLGVWMLNVHASGGLKMMQAAKEAADRAGDRTGRRPLVIAVTVLTSFDQAMLEGTGVNRPIPAQVEHLAALTKEAGLDGVVASPHEIDAIRARCGSDFLIVTPGIRTGPVAPGDDQVRTRSAREAMDAGASYLVVGRPILKAADPAAAAQGIALTLKA